MSEMEDLGEFDAIVIGLVEIPTSQCREVVHHRFRLFAAFQDRQWFAGFDCVAEAMKDKSSRQTPIRTLWASTGVEAPVCALLHNSMAAAVQKQLQ